MKKLFLPVVLSSLLLFYSCSKKDKAVEEYCNCMNTIISDSLINDYGVDTLKKQCFDSIIINKFELGKDADFIEGFDSIEEVKQLVVNRNNQVSQNISRILENYYFQTTVDYGWKVYEYRRYEFDGKMFTQNLYQCGTSHNWWLENTWTGTYKVENEPNGNVYVYITYSSGKNYIYRLKKSSKDGYYLKGRRTLWQEEK